MQVKLKRTIAVANSLGEGVLWDDRRQEILWTDLVDSKLYIHKPSQDLTRQVDFPDYLCSFGLSEDGERLICALRTGITVVDRTTWNHEWLYRLASKAGVRLNDGRVDRQGRFWVGGMVEGPTDPQGATGELLCVTADGRVRSHLDGISISNSTCWSPDGRTMYFADTPTREICAFDFDIESGTLGKRQVFASTPKGAFPDGSTVDCDGYLWNAEWGTGKVVRYAPDGRIDTEIDLPVSQATCLAFGGSDLSELYVTTANTGLSDESLKSQPQAGSIFVFETSARGLREARFIDRTGVTLMAGSHP